MRSYREDSSIEDLALWSRRLLPSPLLHEGCFEAIKLCEPLTDISDSRLKEDAGAHLPDSNFISFEAEFARKTYSLTAAVTK